MARKRNIALGMSAACAIAGGGWWWRSHQAPEPGLRDAAMIDAAMRPATMPFIARHTIAAGDCPLPTQWATPALPAQSALPSGMKSFPHRHGRLQPLAGFSVDARVLSAHRYADDREADFSPIDLVLGWGRMRDDDVLAMLQISQQNRWYYLRWDRSPPISIAQARLESANMHMIPANREIATALNGVRPGQRVRIDGWLVEVQAKDGWRWRSSTTRDDHGPGGCEVIRVCAVSLE